MNIKKQPDHAVRVLIVNARALSTTRLESALQAAGFVVLGVVDEDDDVHRSVRKLQPDAIIIDSESPTRDTLEGLASLGRQYPHPIVILSDRDDARLVRDAMQRGISAYVVEGVPPPALRSLIEVSMLHFRSQRLLVAELEQAQQQGDERLLVDRAKSLVMQRENLSEDEAYHWLRRRAMTQGQKLSTVARLLLQRAGD